jgi:uncharacterized membrane protein required for colicin V production
MLSSSLFDIFLTVIILLFSMIGYFRGFSKEFSSFITLVCAILLSYILTPIISPMVVAKFSYSKILVDIAIRFLLFIAIYFLIFLITRKAQVILSEKISPPLNGSLGFMFSFCKIYFIFSLLFSGITHIYSHGLEEKTTQKVGPKWLTESISYNFLDFGQDIVEPIFLFVAKRLIPSTKKDTQSIVNIKSITDALDIDLKNNALKKTGYSKENIQELDKLINNISK